MKCEIAILTGARAGVRETIDKAYIGLGRHPMSDVRFDAEKDIDASTRHAAILLTGAQYVLRDLGSTNGTFVNRHRVTGDVELKDGDVIKCGVHGPEVEFHLVLDAQEEMVMKAMKGPAAVPERRPSQMKDKQAAAANSPLMKTAGGTPSAVSGPPSPPSKTSVLRAQIAVQRSRFRAITAFLLIVLVGSASVLVYTNQQSQKAQAAAQARADSLARFVGQMQSAKSEADSAIKALRTQLAAETDPRRKQALQAEMSNAVQRMQHIDNSIQNAGDVDYNSILYSNRQGVAVITVQMEGDTSAFFIGTGFNVSPEGRLLTNRHVVAGEHGTGRAAQIAVQFSGSREVLRAQVEKIAPDMDLAVVRITDRGPFPVISGMSQDASLHPGDPIVLIGFPGYGGDRNIPVATGVTGSVDEIVTDSLLRLDAYSGGGASGSPILDRNGKVVGIEFGGLAGSGGRAILGLPIRRAQSLLTH